MALTSARGGSTSVAAPPSNPVLHQSAGNGEVDKPPGHLDRIPDLSGNDNHFWSMDEPPTLDTSLGIPQWCDFLLNDLWPLCRQHLMIGVVP